MSHPPTPQQAIIVDAVRGSDENLLIRSYAGTGKTTTLTMVTAARSNQRTVAIAFNKRIADEMRTRFGPNVDSSTINSLGHRVWGAATGKRLIVDARKTYGLLRAYAESLPRARRADVFDDFSEILKLVDLARLAGYVPKSVETETPSLCEIEELFDDANPPAYKVDIVQSVLRSSINMARDGKIDFTDQIYMPTMFGGSFPQYPCVVVDEAQDLSALNHFMLSRLARLGKKSPSRVIAVGDSLQSIYAFRGAVPNGMDQLKLRFNMTELPLSVTFRCPKQVVALAQGHAPALEAAPSAPEGSVEYLDTWAADEIPDGAVILCRNNAPLMKTALRLLARKRTVNVHGQDIGPQIVKQMRKISKDDDLKQTAVLSEISRWEAQRLTEVKDRAKGGVIDRAACMRVFAEYGETLGAAIAHAENLFKQSGTVQMMTGHKSKGLEFDVVYHLEPHLIPAIWAKSEIEVQQELNLRYVITTRTKNRLVHVDMETLE